MQFVKSVVLPIAAVYFPLHLIMHTLMYVERAALVSDIFGCIFLKYLYMYSLSPYLSYAFSSFLLHSCYLYGHTMTTW